MVFGALGRFMVSRPVDIVSQPFSHRILHGVRPCGRILFGPAPGTVFFVETCAALMVSQDVADLVQSNCIGDRTFNRADCDAALFSPSPAAAGMGADLDAMFVAQRLYVFLHFLDVFHCMSFLVFIFILSLFFI
ncbi:hypothetical protein [Geoalkalibacter subterraneus]|uniref:hypothetical protein n=1 Tax=Geoalkalibacter subterraneus TaxID=483547 RepID=UPI00130E63DF|nr:hypothetical protein [Geoalkalibacter subterraneus]